MRKSKKRVRHKNHTYSSYSSAHSIIVHRINTDLFNKFQSFQAHLKTAIEESKQNYYSHLSDKILPS